VLIGLALDFSFPFVWAQVMLQVEIYSCKFAGLKRCFEISSSSIRFQPNYLYYMSCSKYHSNYLNAFWTSVKSRMFPLMVFLILPS
jgi:hypothetical protein